MSQDRKIIALVRDLMFSGKISAEVRAAGIVCKTVRDLPRLPDFIDCEMLIVDLTMDGAIPAVQGWRAAGGSAPIIGFAPHVEAELIRQAKAGGFDQVLTRGQFVQVLPQILRDLAKDSTQNNKETHEHPSHSS